MPEVLYGCGMTSISPVLDAFAAGAAAGDPDRAEAIHQAAESSVVTFDEKDMLLRAVTAASRSGSKAAGESLRTRLITDPDQAFAEATSSKPVQNAGVLRVLAKLEEVLLLAADTIGPLPGGRIGGSQPVGGRGSTFEPAEPGPKTQVELARAAGEVVGLAGALLKTDPLAEIRALNDGCPVCGAPVVPTAAKAQELEAKTAQPIAEGEEFGECEVEHRLKRPEGTIGQWIAVGRDELFAE